LIELLTVIAMIAVLATLLLTTVSSVKRKAKETVCSSNLRQIAIALTLYLDDFGARPTNLPMLVDAKYLGDGKILMCPADKNVWSSQAVDSRSGPVGQAGTSSNSIRVSYESPLAWTDEQWNRLLQSASSPGIAVCKFHDVNVANGKFSLSTDSPTLILRGNLDGTIVRRQVFGLATDTGNNPLPGAASEVLAPTAGAASAAAPNPPWPLFSDDSSP
jgi:type II secretory pathway pseudopilin PulG